MSHRVFELVSKLNHPNIMAPQFFTDDEKFYVTRTYDDDYVI